jgi:hypothetical protein
MPSYFFDSSALVKRYHFEPGSAWVRSICDPRTRPPLYLSRPAQVEVVAALRRTGRYATKGCHPLPWAAMPFNPSLPQTTRGHDSLAGNANQLDSHSPAGHKIMMHVSIVAVLSDRTELTDAASAATTAGGTKTGNRHVSSSAANCCGARAERLTLLSRDWHGKH